MNEMNMTTFEQTKSKEEDMMLKYYVKNNISLNEDINKIINNVAK